MHRRKRWKKLRRWEKREEVEEKCASTEKKRGRRRKMKRRRRNGVGKDEENTNEIRQEKTETLFYVISRHTRFSKSSLRKKPTSTCLLYCVCRRLAVPVGGLPAATFLKCIYLINLVSQ
jgi:hypothetical protein